MFEHASDSRLLLKLLQSTKSKEEAEKPQLSTIYFIKIKSAKEEVQENPEKKTFLEVDECFIQLTLKANGKADLYFHAYLWFNFILSLYQRGNTDNIEEFN